jgi:hypothetical protein
MRAVAEVKPEQADKGDHLAERHHGVDAQGAASQPSMQQNFGGQ